MLICERCGRSPREGEGIGEWCATMVRLTTPGNTGEQAIESPYHEGDLCPECKVSEDATRTEDL